MRGDLRRSGRGGGSGILAQLKKVSCWKPGSFDPDEDKKQISFPAEKQKGDTVRYNAQISVDGKSQVIVGQHVSQQANDSQEVAQLGERSVAGRS